MDVVKSALGERPSAISLLTSIIVLLHGDAVARDGRDPSDVAVVAGVGLGDGAGDGLAVDGDAGLLGGGVPGVGVAPGGALVAVGEVDAEAVVDAPGDEAGALALVVVPLVDAAALARVGVVVLGRAGDFPVAAAAAVVAASIALVGHEAIAAGPDVEVGDVAAVGGLVPDVVAEDVRAGGLAGDVHVLVFRIALLDVGVDVRARATGYGVMGNGEGAHKGGGQGEGEGSNRGELHGG